MRAIGTSRVLSICLVLLLVALIVWTIEVFAVSDRSMAIHRLETEATRLASTLFFAKMTTIAQLALGLLGAGWAFMTLADTKIELATRDAKTCFAVANGSLGASLIIYSVGHDFIVERVFHHSTFDIDAPFVAAVSHLQQASFVLGLAALVVTIFLGRKP